MSLSPSSSSFDFSAVEFLPLPDTTGLDLFIYDIDDQRQIVDLLFRFAPNKLVAPHIHLAQTNMLILQGELRIYHSDGTLKQARPAGRYYRGVRDDQHSEGGGPDGAIVFYSVRGHGDEELIRILNEQGEVVSTLDMAAVRLLHDR